MQPSKHPSLSIHLGAPVRAAILCGAALALFSLAGAPAFAQDLGDLKAQLEAWQKRIDQLEAEQKDQQKVIEAVPYQKIVTSGKEPVTLSLS